MWARDHDFGRDSRGSLSGQALEAVAHPTAELWHRRGRVVSLFTAYRGQLSAPGQAGTADGDLAGARGGERTLVRLLLSLSCSPAEPNPPNSRCYIKDRNITLHHLAADEFAASYDPLSEETVLQALDLILDPTNAPILVCCGQGRHRTGTVIGCLRKLQHWALTATLEEYRRCVVLVCSRQSRPLIRLVCRYAGPKVRVGNEQFIEQFDVDLIVVPPPPASPNPGSSS